MTAASSISEHLTLVHASLAGRTRFEVAGLYRSNRIKQRHESALSDINGINRITANSLTGCLLVLYEPDITLEDIIAAIEQHIDRDGPALKAADIGVAMGASGTNVARDVSDVLQD